MNSFIEVEIRQFESLQKKYADFGADDSESDYIFQIVIAHAITKDPVDVDMPIEWELYEDSNSEGVSKELTIQAWKTYKAIQSHAQPSDLIELKKYCWRLDPIEFTPWTDLAKNEK